MRKFKVTIGNTIDIYLLAEDINKVKEKAKKQCKPGGRVIETVDCEYIRSGVLST